MSGINLLVERLKEAPNHEGLKKTTHDLIKLRADLTPLVEGAGEKADDFVPIMRDLRALESDLLSIIRAETDPNTQSKSPPSQEI